MRKQSTAARPARPSVRSRTIATAIHLLRGERVILDGALAALYGVETRELVQAVKRNADRFPADFMFQLTAREVAALRSQSVILDSGRGRHRKYLPYAFTEHGVAMLSGVLRSSRAVRVNLEIIRAFVRLRHLLASNADLARKVAALEIRYDGQFAAVFRAISALIVPPTPRRKRIGFDTA